MTVTVEYLDSQAELAAQQEIYTMTMTRLDVVTPDPARDVVRFPYNPEGYVVGTNPRWTSRNEAGAYIPSHHWDGNDPVSITLDTPLQTPENEPLDKLILTLEDWATRPTDATQRPTRILFNAGVYTKIVVIGSVNANRVRTNSRGQVIQAQLVLELFENEAEF